MIFADIAMMARTLRGSNPMGDPRILGLIEDLAEVLNTFEHNVARQFALDHMPQAPKMSMNGASEMRRWEMELDQRRRWELESLRADPVYPTPIW